MSTIDRLLNKQEPKRRRKNAAADPYEGIDEEGFEGPKAPAAFVRYIQTEEGSRLLVPQEWIDAPAGEVFSTSIKPLHHVPPFRGRLIEEVE
jgi:Ino eighty subunit 2